MEGKKYNIERFINAQISYGSYDRALQEMKAGHKQGHWIWFVFPQLVDLGYSSMAKYYGIANIKEAMEYLQNETLHSRLREIISALLTHRGEDILYVMGGMTDALKLRSSMTLFWCASRQMNDQKQGDAVFKQVIDAFFFGTFDDKTLTILKKQA